MFSKMISFAMAVASRGLENNKIDIETKKVRYLSCFGHDKLYGCPRLKKSSKSKYYYCGACGCGDHTHSWLLKEPGEYAKLDYPVLNCPLKMPGFTNYDPNGNLEKDRRQYIENLDPEKLDFIQLTISFDPEKEKILNELNKLNENS